ncbi:MAG: Fic family protein [Christensenellaceae bacterium]|jgi:Fic family protein|nr:Fic family protein [Christensenellaceae bacterium]
MTYTPPYNLNDEILEIVALITESLGQISSIGDLNKFPRLRRTGRILSIQSTLAIENNTLTYEQVTDLINGKRVLGKPQEIQEVKNAFEAYKQIGILDPTSIQDMLRAHEVMMFGLDCLAGKFRSGGVGVFNSYGDVVHMAPHAKMVHSLISDLFDYLKDTKTHPLIKSCVFHYEFEIIHPFQDGNGRMGRLWQTMILNAWKPIFAYIPVESIVKFKQEEYYNAISKSDATGNSNCFIIFMLNAILEAVKLTAQNATEHINHINTRMRNLLKVMEDYPMSAKDIMEKLNLKSKLSFRLNYLQPAIEIGLIKQTIPEKPTSKNQQYIKT